MSKLGEKIKAATAKVEELALAKGLQTIADHTDVVDQVVDEFSAWADEEAKWDFLGPLAAFAEHWDGPAIQAIASAFVHQALHHLESTGKLGS